MGLQSQLLGSLPTMATLGTSFLVILGNNQASPVLMEADGPPDDYEEAEPLTVKTQNHGNGDDYFLYGDWRDYSYYDSNGIDCPDVRKKFNPQIIHRGK